MNKSISRLVKFGVPLVLLSLSGGVERTPARADDAKNAKPTGEAIERLLKAAKLDFKQKDNMFRVLVEVKGEVTAVFIEEKKAPWKANNGSEVLFAYMFCEVLKLPKDFKPPSGMLLRMAEMNNVFNFGNVSLNKNREGEYAIFFNSSCFLRGCDAEQLTDFLYMTHNTRLYLRKEFSRYLEDR